MFQTAPHYMSPAVERGKSPGNGISAPIFSEDPMMMEEEFYRGMERERQLAALTTGRDRRVEGRGLDAVPELAPGPDVFDEPAAEPGERLGLTSAPQDDELLPTLSTAGDSGTFGPGTTR
jgi:hypothetical protein